MEYMAWRCCLHVWAVAAKLYQELQQKMWMCVLAHGKMDELGYSVGLVPALAMVELSSTMGRRLLLQLATLTVVVSR